MRATEVNMETTMVVSILTSVALIYEYKNIVGGIGIVAKFLSTSKFVYDSCDHLYIIIG